MTTATEKLNLLTARAEAAAKRCQSIQVQLETARNQYAMAKEDARNASKSKSDDLDVLREELRTLDAENMKAVEEFDAALNQYENLLQRIERAMADPEALNELLLELSRVVDESVTAVAAATSTPAATSAERAQPVVFDDGEI